MSAFQPVLESGLSQQILRARAIELPPSLLRALVAATWRLRLQPTSPGQGMLTPIMDVSRARRELGWTARAEAGRTLLELLEGLRAGAGLETPRSPRSAAGLALA
jgi:UDP-glucose 4-epimerase